MKRCAEEPPKCPQPKPYLGPTINTRPSRPTASSGLVMIMMTLPGLSRKVGKVAQTCGLLPPSPPSTLEFSSIIGECPSDGYDGDEGSAEEGDQVTGNPISPRLGPPAYISRCWMGLVFQFFCKRTCLGVIYHIHIFKGIQKVWMPRTFQTRIVSGMHKARRQKNGYLTVRLTASVPPPLTIGFL